MRQQQRQRVSRKKIILICAISLSCMIAGFTIFFNMVHVDHLKATSDEADIPVFITSEQTLVNEKSISEPVVARHMDSSAHVLLAKRVNRFPATATPGK